MIVVIYSFNGLIVFHAPSVCLLTMGLTFFVSCMEGFCVLHMIEIFHSRNYFFKAEASNNLSEFYD